MLLKESQNIIGIEKVDDVVKRLLSLEMANQEKLKIKQEQLINKVMDNPVDTSSLEAQIVPLTVKIHNYEEHMQKTLTGQSPQALSADEHWPEEQDAPKAL